VEDPRGTDLGDELRFLQKIKFLANVFYMLGTLGMYSLMSNIKFYQKIPPGRSSFMRYRVVSCDTSD